jgi:hypothetical protein
MRKYCLYFNSHTEFSCPAADYARQLNDSDESGPEMSAILSDVYGACRTLLMANDRLSQRRSRDSGKPRAQRRSPRYVNKVAF